MALAVSRTTGAFGTENRQDTRYRLSFTAGALLLPHGRALASYFLEHAPADVLDQARQTPELGSAVAVIRSQAIASNVLAIQSETANARYVRETLKRLSALTFDELTILTGDDAMPSDRRLIMWLAMCRYYAFVGDFATDVLRERFLLGEPTVTFDDYARFVRNKTLWHPELETLTDATAKKLRSCLFGAMAEAELLTRTDHAVMQAPPTALLAHILEVRPESLKFLPMRKTTLQ